MTDESLLAAHEYKPERRRGTEHLTGGDKPLPTLSDFWSWSSSDLLSNATRGVLAEFIVGTALGCISPDAVRREWDAYDLVFRDALVEVKSTAHVQSWGRTTTSALRFGIGETRAWSLATKQYSDDRKRQADIYVFAVLGKDDGTLPDPLNVEHWNFYVVPTTTLDEVFEQQQAVSLSKLIGIGSKSVSFNELKDRVASMIQLSTPQWKTDD